MSDTVTLTIDGQQGAVARTNTLTLSGVGSPIGPAQNKTIQQWKILRRNNAG